MISPSVRSAAIALTFLTLSSPVAEACGCRGGAPAYAPVTAGYAPYVASYAPAGYGQVVNYMPQTAYRTVYVNRPVVAAYSPVTACNACGGATTVLRPITGWAPVAQVVPYMTYRPVVVSAAMPVMPACATGCAPAMPVTSAYYAPPVVAAPAAACCTPSSYSANYGAVPAVAPAPAYAPAPAATSTYAPLGTPGATVRSLAPPPGYSPAPAAAPSAAAPPAGADQPPALDAPTNGTLDKTFDDTNTTPPQPQSRVILPPRNDPSNSNTSGAGRLLDRDETRDRTTSMPLGQTLAVRPVSTASAAPAAKAKLNDGGWRAARN